MKYSSGTLNLSLLGLHWATLHVLPGILKPGPLCCPELSSQPWHWAALERASQVPEEDPTRPGGLRSQAAGGTGADSPQTDHRQPPPQYTLLLGEGPGGGGQEHTHPKPTPGTPGRHSTSWLPKASALLAQRLRNPRGFPRPGMTTAAAARASRAPHPSRPMLGTQSQAPTGPSLHPPPGPRAPGRWLPGTQLPPAARPSGTHLRWG